MKFKVEYSVERDMYNYLNTMWRMKYRSFGRDDLQKRLLSRKPAQFQSDIKAAQTEEEAKRVINDFLAANFKENESQFEKSVDNIQKILDQNQSKIIEKLEKLFGKKFPFKEITVYLTTAGICPYNYEKRWYMCYINADKDRVLGIASHELNHFMFYFYHYPYLEEHGINEYKLKVLKEALPFISGDEGTPKPDVIELGEYLKSLKGKGMDEIIALALQSEVFNKIKPR